MPPQQESAFAGPGLHPSRRRWGEPSMALAPTGRSPGPVHRIGKCRIQCAEFRDEIDCMTIREGSEDQNARQVDLLGAEVELAERAKPAAPDPAAEAMLAALQQRIAAAKPASSSIARQLVQRERKQRRAELAAQVMPEAMPVHVAPEAVPEYHEGRYRAEDEPWFAGLPAAEQDRLRAVWDQQRADVCGKGRVLLISPHPESHTELDALVARAIGWTVGIEPQKVAAKPAAAAR